MKEYKRRTDEFILLMLSAAGAIAVFPFAVIRLLNSDWVLLVIDMVLVYGLLLLAVFVYRTHRVRIASVAVSLLSVSAVVATIYMKGMAQVNWMYPGIMILYYLLRPREAILANILAIAALLPILMEALEPLALGTMLITFILTSVFSYAFSTLTSAQRNQLVLQATKDPLTGAGNRRALGQKLEEIAALPRRTPVTASLLLLDLDHFKLINDDFGHAIGDDILVRIVAIIEQRIRITDGLYRLGGEEFLIVADGANCEVAATLAEELRGLVEAAPLVPERPVTISVGIAEFAPGETTDEWLRRADEALYEAKRSGRNNTAIGRAVTSEDIARLEGEAAIS